jgi:hypothetical protein
LEAVAEVDASLTPSPGTPGEGRGGGSVSIPSALTIPSPLSTQHSPLSTSPSILIKGPMPCAINKIAGYYRNQIVLQSPRADLLQKVLLLLRDEGHLATSDRIAVDVDPVSLL